MKKTDISIITPSFNSAKFIEQTIDSVLSQSYPSLEYIIIDGGSTDGTLEIIRKYEKHLFYCVSEPDKGQSNAINKGLKHAKGDVINWLNADDYYEKNALHIVASHFEDPSINCFCGKSNIVDVNGRHLHQSSGTDIYKNNLAKTIGWARIDQPETFFRREVFEELRGVNEEFHYVMDKEFWMRYLIDYGLKNIKKADDIVVNFRFHEQSKSGSSGSKFQEETIKLFASLTNSAGIALDDKFIDVKGSLPDVKWPSLNKEFVENVLQYYYLYLADYYYFSGNKKECKLILQKIKDYNFKDEDLNLLKKLKFRNKLFPEFLQKMKHRFDA